ncbi:MAG: ankyrin repeat domain-containing protein, partial [Terriglobales bacterium]
MRDLVTANPAVVNSRDKMGETPLHLAAKSDHSDVVEFLLDHGADVNARDSNGGFTPLDLALSSFHYKDVLELLIARGANVNTASKQGITPLEEAVMRDQKDAIELLLSKGADINAQDSGGNTALLWALLMGHSDAAKILIAVGADVNVRNG